MANLIKHLTYIRLSNGDALGVFQAKPMVVFNLPRLDGILSGNGRIFDEYDSGPSETKAEEIIEQIELTTGKTVQDQGLVACRFDQNALGQVTTQYVAKWELAPSEEGSFHADRLDPSIPQIEALREMLLLGPGSPESWPNPLLETRSFTDGGHLFGNVSAKGFAGLLVYKNARFFLPSRDALHWLEKPSSAQSTELGVRNMIYPDGKLMFTLTEEAAKQLQSQAAQMLVEFDLRSRRDDLARKNSAAMPQLAAFLLQAVHGALAANDQDVPQSSAPTEVQESLDAFGRAKNILDVMLGAMSSPQSAAFAVAVLAGTYILRVIEKGSKERGKGERP